MSFVWQAASLQIQLPFNIFFSRAGTELGSSDYDYEKASES